jgi:hypothetical protein
MNYTRLALAAIGGLVASFAVGGLLMVLVPALLDEAHKHPTVFRPKEEMMKVMPIGMGATFIAILIAAVIFAMMHPAGATLRDGAIFGGLLGAFVVFGFVLHNYANLNISGKLAGLQSAAYFAQWVAVGIVISLIYKPATP